ncbi:monovalent cation/H+ antiporter complex subunit F [uncultured Amnibacterium sp.]|uniref:monovalent cation/H+ antiporter complex subunit F n=1 Tax=uncultured Amnibacterium sp. TaxID=1631851 RepID=UPI0035CC7921
MNLHGVLLALVGALFAVGAALTVYRVVRGPTILDRMIASDVLLTTMTLVLGAVMALQRRTDLLPVLLVLAGTSAFATIAVARSVSKHDRSEADQTGRDPLATVPDAKGVLERAQEQVAGLDDAGLDLDDLRPTGGRDDA